MRRTYRLLFARLAPEKHRLRHPWGDPLITSYIHDTPRQRWGRPPRPRADRRRSAWRPGPRTG